MPEPGKSKILNIKKEGKYEIVTATNPVSGKGSYTYRRLAKPGGKQEKYIRKKKYGKKGTGFSKAFREARDAGQDVFTWKGESYHTKTGSEMKGGGMIDRYNSGGIIQHD